MSLGIIIKGPEGLVLAAESRITLTASSAQKKEIPVSFDNARKVLKFVTPHNYVGAVTYGLGGIGLRSAYSFLPEFESILPKKRLSVKAFAEGLSDFFVQQWNTAMPKTFKGPNLTFVVGGFNPNEAYGRVYLIEIPRAPNPKEMHPGMTQFGITWGGQRETVDRLIRGYDVRVIKTVSKELNLNTKQIKDLGQKLSPLQMPIPVRILPLQDCVDLAIFFIRTTIEAQRLTVGIRGCGGPIDVATITRLEGFKFVQEKQIHGELPTASQLGGPTL